MTFKLGILSVAALLGISFASSASAQTCGEGAVYPKSGNFLFKPRAAHFKSQSVVIAPKNNFDPIQNTNNIASVTMHRADTGKKIARANLKSTGFCPGWGECLNAPTYTFGLTGFAAQRRFPQGIYIKLRYKTAVTGTVDGVKTKVNCETFEIQNSRCRTPCDITSITRPGEYHHPSCSKKWPGCISVRTNPGY